MVCPVKLYHCKFWIVRSIHSFVAKISIDLKYCFKSTNYESFEVELWSDSKISIYPKSIMVCDKWSCIGSTWNWVHHRSLHLQKAVTFKKISNQAYDAATEYKNFFHIRIHNEIEVALAVAKFLVLESMVFFR